MGGGGTSLGFPMGGGGGFNVLPGGGGPVWAPFSSKFSSAVGTMAPPQGQGISKLASLLMPADGGGTSQQGSGGPLDAGNWESSRTASLVVRGVPSANLFLSATGMAG